MSSPSDEKNSIRLEEKTAKNYNSVSPPENDTEEYDPHLHRQVPHPTTNIETLVHILKGSLGTGILAMPQAFLNAGYVSGLINTFIIGFLCTYCLHVLVKSQYILCKRHRIPILSYPISMKMALEEGPHCLRWIAPAAIAIVDGFLIVYQLGICCVYIVFVATNIQAIATKDIDVKLYMCMLLLPLILMSSIRNLKLLAPFSTLANVLTFIGIGILLYYILDQLPDISTVEPVGEIGNFPLFFGTVLFALEAVGVIIALENNMKTPKSFGGYCGVLNIGMAVIVILYAGMGFLGYLKWGVDVKGSITLNLPANEMLAQSVNVIFAIAIFISYGLQGYVPVDIIWNTYLKKRFDGHPRQLLFEYVVRIAVVIVTFLLAVAIPRLGLFISLFGALCLSVLGLAFPAIMELCVLWPDDLGPFKYILIKDLLLILFGIIGLVAGTYVSIRDIVISFM